VINAVIPFLFLPAIALVSKKLGIWFGILSTVAVAIIAAEFLFDPIFSLRISNQAQRNNLAWMFILGIVLSELLGGRPRRPTQGRSNGK
jgi:K+-sensing histidine kinase KdpD